MGSENTGQFRMFRLKSQEKRRGIWPALGLVFVAPLVAEFLLGNLPIKLLPALIVLAPMYGGGALLIREVVRRTGRGWPSILLLGMAYGIFEEAYTTQSLFNPNYLKLNLGIADAGVYSFAGNWCVVDAVDADGAWDLEHLDADCAGGGMRAGSGADAVAGARGAGGGGVGVFVWSLRKHGDRIQAGSLFGFEWPSLLGRRW